MTPELAGAFSARSDSQANALRLQAGLALPFGQRHAVSMVTWRDESRGGFPSASGSVTGLGAAVQLAARGGTSLVVGGDVRYGSADVSGNIAAGGTVPAQRSPESGAPARRPRSTRRWARTCRSTRTATTTSSGASRRSPSRRAAPPTP